jgi:glycosyltransferase involved in cell wall biosynthesis
VNILFVHEVDWLEKVVFEVHNIAELMSQAGHRVYAVDYPDTWRGWSLNPKHLRTRRLENVTRAVPGGQVTLIRPGLIRIPGLSRLAAWFTTRRVIARLLETEQIDVVVLYAVPTSGLQTLNLAHRHRVPVVFRSIDILHRLVRYRWLKPLTRAMERNVYRRADRILAIAPRYAGYVTEMGTAEDKVELILLPVDTELFKPVPPSAELRARWGLADDAEIVLFIGTLFDFSGLDGFIREFPRVISAAPQARLLIVGDGPQRAKLETIIRETGLGDRVIITGFQPYQTMPEYIGLADVCINTFLDTPENRDIFPGKIIQYIAGAKPVVSTPLEGIKTILPGPSHGIVYAGAGNLADEVVNLLQSAQMRRALGTAGMEYVMGSHSYDAISRQFEAALTDVVSQYQQTGAA